MARFSFSSSIAVILAGWLSLASQMAWGQSTEQVGNEFLTYAVPPKLPWLERPALFDGPGTARDSLRQSGIGVQFTEVQYYQGQAAGDGRHDWEHGGKLLGKVNLDGEKLGLWEGFSVDMVPEYNHGQNVNAVGGTLLPVNTALAFPQNGGSGGDLSLTLTQRFNEQVSVSIGKFNMIQAASRTPILGGGGIDTFWNVGLAGPITGLVPPYLTGAALDIRTSTVVVSMMIYDPSGSQKSTGLEHWGSNGVTGRLMVTLPRKFAGLPSYHNFVLVGSSVTGTDLEDLPQLILPPGTGSALGTKQGAYHVGYSIQQYLWVNPRNPAEGWGAFGQTGISDSNPTPFSWMFLAGLGGTGLIPGRSLDRYGVGYFHYAFSDELADGLKLFGLNLGDEHGVELFYNAAVTPWFRITGDLQIIRPGDYSRDAAVFAGLSAQLKF